MSSSPSASPAGLGSAPIGRTASPRPSSAQNPPVPAASPAAPRSGLPSRPPPQQPDLARRSYGAAPSPNPNPNPSPNPSSNPTNSSSAQSSWRASSGLTPSAAAINQRLASASRGHNSLLTSPLAGAFGGLGNTAHASLSPGFGASQPQRPGTIGGVPAGAHLSLSAHGTPADQTGTMDRWYEDLQNYEHTLEEMAAASLDANFKEELGAIEQWFRVLSEAERTAALYSLLQESTQVQIRFFITVLQQMARTDPVHALLSPVTGSHNGVNSMMAEQLEAKMANLGLAPPAAQAPQAQTSKPYRSPALDGNAALSQAARLKANRTSAPEHLAHFTGSNASAASSNAAPFSSSRLDDVSEGVASSARPRPSTLGGTTGSQTRSPVPGSGPTSPPPEEPAPASHSASRSASRPTSGEAPLPAAAHEYPSDASNEWDGTNAAVLQQAQLQAQLQAQGGLYDPAQAADLLRSPNAAALLGSPLAGLGSPNAAAIGGLSPAALAGLQSPSGGLGNPANLQAMNALAGLGAGLSAPQLISLQQSLLAQIAVTNGQFAGAPPQGLSPHMGGGMRLPSGQQYGAAGSRQASRNFHGAGLNVAAANAPPGSRVGGASVKSPRLGAPRSPGPVRRAHSPAPRPHTPHNEEEVADLSVLEDTAAWLRQLRLHKYTTNFATSHWQDMVAMDDAALQAMGVAALGARRKMLKTFDAVRKRHGIPDPPSVAAEKKAAAAAAVAGVGSAATSNDATSVPPVPRLPTPQPEQ